MNTRTTPLHQAEHKAFTVVATLVAGVVLGAGWSLLADSKLPDVTLAQVATSDLVSLGTLVLFRLSCLAIALYTLWHVYFDRKGLEMHYLDTTITLRRLGRWTTFTVWCFSLLLAYFSLATVCSTAVLVGRDDAIPSGVVFVTLILFEVSYPMSLLVTAVVTFVLFPLARRNHYPTDRMFRWRPQVMHNGNTIMMQLTMLIAPPPVAFAHLPYVVLFGCCYAVFSWLWFWRTGVFYYFFLDYRRPYAAYVYLGLFVVFSTIYGVTYLIATVVSHTDSRWWTYPGIMVTTLSITRFRATAALVPAVARPLHSIGDRLQYALRWRKGG